MNRRSNDFTMSHASMFRADLVRPVAVSVGCFLTFLVASFRLHKSQRDSHGEEQRTASTQDHMDLLPVPTVCTADKKQAGEYRLYGAKTLYERVRDKTVHEINVPGCIPKQFWLLSRHGTRYPGPFEMSAFASRLPLLKELILDNVHSGKGRLSETEGTNFERWQIQFAPSLDNQLTPGGVKEMEQLAQRFKERFPSLLGRDFSSDSYRFRHTDSHRTADSARHFASGLFGASCEVKIPEPVKDDPIIKFYKTCRKWKEEVDDNEESREERTRFRHGPEMQRVVHNVSSRLGFSQNLPFDDVHLMFTMCRFESAVYPGRSSSPWCAVFRREELEVMEYDEDLDYYWTDGYGFPINYEQACPPIKDFLDHFRAAMRSDSDAPLGVFHFSHSGLLLKVYARLGMFRDEKPPRADNFREQMSRQWRSSLIDPFTANLALVLFECADVRKHQLMAFVQERPISLPIPGCDSRLLCPMDTVLANYGALADACNLSVICDGSSENYSQCRQRRPPKYNFRSAGECAISLPKTVTAPLRSTDVHHSRKG